MNKKYVLPIAFAIILASAFFVIAMNWSVEVNFDFGEGWNLVYGLLDPNQLDGQVLEKQSIKAVYAFIPSTQQYLRAWPDPDSKAWEDLDNVMDDHELLQTAFWVYTDKGAMSEYWLYDAPTQYTERQIYKGWNFVGITSDMISDSEIENLKGSCNIEKSYFWVNEYQEWRDLPLFSKFNDNRYVGSAWVIRVSNNCNLGTSVNIPQVPRMPN